jgi:hypothetical protein
LFVGLLDEFLDLEDGLLEVVVVEVFGLHVLDVVADEQLVLAEPLHGFDEVRIKLV